MINRLIDIISREAALFESFLQLLVKQKESLVLNDIDGLNEATEQQQQMLAQSRQLNNERERLVVQIKADNAVEGDLNVARLLDMVDKDQADQLARLRESILSLNDQINQTRNSNAMLLNQSRECIAKTMEALARINRPEATYVLRGRSSSGSTASVAVDRRA